MKKTQLCNSWKFGIKGQEKKEVILPHDAMQEQGRDASAPSGKSEAYFLGGIYEYETSIRVPENLDDGLMYLEFEGVYPNASVYVNGKLAGACEYGYSSFCVPVQGVDPGEDAVITVTVDDQEHPKSRWYGGAGIFRPVWLVEMPKEHIIAEKTRITTCSCDPAVIEVCTSVDAESDTRIFYEIMDGQKIVASGEGPKARISISDAKLWSDQQPYLYSCRVLLMRNEKILDEQVVSFGIRTLEWSTEGFFINGRSVKLKGGCIHHDHGILGARTFEEAEIRRLRKMKEFGFNAVRSAHNPLSQAALDACDRLGLYVMDETWDTWNYTKSEYDFGKNFFSHYESDILKMVEKDYNHPSVVMYSIGNEVTEPAKAEGVELGKEIVKKVKDLDTTRPVTAGLNLTLLLLAKRNAEKAEATQETTKHETEPDTKPEKKMDSTAFNEMVMGLGKRMTMAAATEEADQVASPFLEQLDICGYNYAVSRYEKEGELHPERIIVGSETYPGDLGAVWKIVESTPYLIGDFMWTAWDYIGEVGLGAWSYEKEPSFDKPYPWLLADTGAFDILGNDNGEAGLASVVWEKRKTPYIAVSPVNHPGIVPLKATWRSSNALPYWSYYGCDGNEAEVEVYTKCAVVELFINGKSIGKSNAVDYKAVFHTVYERGELVAVVYDQDGIEQSRSSLCSAVGDTKIRICPESEPEIGKLLYVPIDLVGENGEVECNKDEKLSVEVTGGKLLAFGSANPKTEESFLDGSYTSYYGRTLAVVLPTDKELLIRVEGQNLGVAEYKFSPTESKEDDKNPIGR
ncbi:MAG: glycoside hydrolase family 2 TIM barrel-domain containing protein [Eubacteriales bacterium]|nr:glycoside hydrolase family 2 TIM barrel-domain containing protein [Eubacteriales bacterium]